MLLLAWTTFAFAGVYPSSLIVPAILCVVLGLVCLPAHLKVRPTAHRGGYRAGGSESTVGRLFRGAFAQPHVKLRLTADLMAVSAIVGVIGLQLVPLPAAIVHMISPHAAAFREQFTLSAPGAWMPLTIDRASTVWALAVVAGVALVFFASRALLEIGGTRMVVRGVSATGLVLAALALAQDATAHGLMYWRWKPIEEGAPPFGPFVDRNHFATWVVLAIPLCLGYLVAHAEAHRHRALHGASWHRPIVHALDARAIWLTSSVGLMLVALVASLSRSGLVGLAVALVTGWFLRAARPGARAGERWVGVAAALGLVAAAVRVNPMTVVHRFGAAGTAAIDRLTIWRATIPIVRDFWTVGTGAGTFETAMLVYQRPGSAFRINAAHNHYLQAAAEGGVLLVAAAAFAAVAFVRAAIARLREDRSGMYWMRAGALSGLVGVAAQSLWETGLTTPANGVLAAIAGAIAVHRAAPHHHE